MMTLHQTKDVMKSEITNVGNKQLAEQKKCVAKKAV